MRCDPENTKSSCSTWQCLVEKANPKANPKSRLPVRRPCGTRLSATACATAWVCPVSGAAVADASSTLASCRLAHALSGSTCASRLSSRYCRSLSLEHSVLLVRRLYAAGVFCVLSCTSFMALLV